MEQVEVPPFIPKAERHFVPRCGHCNGCGQNTGLHSSRTFGHRSQNSLPVRRQTRTTGKTVEVTKSWIAYSATLPKEHRDHMPSLGDWYGQLSQCLHQVREDAELFERARYEILSHFDIRRVFKVYPRVGVVVGKHHCSPLG